MSNDTEFNAFKANQIKKAEDAATTMLDNMIPNTVDTLIPKSREKQNLDSTVGIKYDADKIQTELLSSIAILELSKVLTFGAKKYAAHNWRKGISRTRLLGALLRHTFAYLGGEDKDPETGLSHIAHAMCCCMFILELEVTRKDTDDRFKAGAVGSSQ